VAHPLELSTLRPNWFLGQKKKMSFAVNVCLGDWMNADDRWNEEHEDWLALKKYLATFAPEITDPDEEIPALEYAIIPAPFTFEGGDPIQGRALFNGSCSVCHGLDGSGTLLAPELLERDLPVAYIAKRIRTSGPQNSAVHLGLDGGLMPFWSRERMSDGELLDVVTFVSTAYVPDPGPADDVTGSPDGTSNDATVPGEDCANSHPHVGWTATFIGKYHGVAGQAIIINDCTIRIDNFEFDGDGLDVRIYGASDGLYQNGFPMTENLYNFPTGYTGETIYALLPTGKTLDDLDGISVWSVYFGLNYGDAVFSSGSP
jgi:mono/diheme cytochrome c family protein